MYGLLYSRFYVVWKSTHVKKVRCNVKRLRLVSGDAPQPRFKFEDHRLRAVTLSTAITMTSLARRSLVHLTRQSPRLYRPLPTLARPFTISALRRQIPLETPAVEEEIAGLNDAPVFIDDDTTQVDWSRSFHGLSTQPFSEEAAKILTAPLATDDVEIKPGLSPLSFLCESQPASKYNTNK